MARRPYSGRLTSAFGPRVAPIAGASTNHLGEDGVGGPNVAPERVRVLSYGYAGGWGNLITCIGLDTGYTHLLAHNAANGLLVAVGGTYAEGTPLGVQGMTGTATGVHVHWETLDGNGNHIDPSTWLAAYGNSGGGGGGAAGTGEIRMRNIRNNAGAIMTISPFGARPVASSDWPATAKLWGDFVQLSDLEFNAQVSLANQRGDELAKRIAPHVKPAAPVIDYAKLATELAPRLNVATPDSVLARLRAFWSTGK